MLKHLRNYSTSTIVSSAITFLALPFFTRYLTPNDFGILGLYFIFGNITTSFLTIGLGLSTTRAFYKNESSFNSLNSTNFVFIIIMLLIGGIIVWATSEKIAFYFFDNKILPKIVMLSYIGGSLSRIFVYLHDLLIAQERSGSYSILALLSSVLNTLISIFLILTFSMTYDSRIFSDIIKNMFLITTLIYLQRKYFTIRLSKKTLKWSIKLSWPRIPQLISGLIQQSFDKIILSKYKDLSQLGNYEIANKMSQICRAMISTVAKAWIPYFMKKSELRTDSAKTEIINRYQEVVMVFNSLAFVICLFCEDIIILMTTVEFYPSMFLVPAIIATMLFTHTITTIAKPQILFNEKLQYMLPSSFISVIANVLFNIILIPKYGAIGAVIALFLASILSNLILFYFAQKVYPLPYNYYFLIGQFFYFLGFLISIYNLMLVDYPLYIKLCFKLFLLIIYFYLAIKFTLIKKERLLLLWDNYRPIF